MKFKNYSLSVQFSIIFTTFIVFFVLLFTSTLTLSLKTSFKKDLYNLMEYAEETEILNLSKFLYSKVKSNKFTNNDSSKGSNQNSMKEDIFLKDKNAQTFKLPSSNRFKDVYIKHIYSEFDFILRANIHRDIPLKDQRKFLKMVYTQFENQEEDSKEYYYEFKLKNSKVYPIYYKLTKTEEKIYNNIKSYILSSNSGSTATKMISSLDKYNSSEKKLKGIMTYSSNNTTNTLVNEILSNILPFLLGGTLVALILGILLSKYLTKPLKKLKIAVKNIGERNWNTPLTVDRMDEIGELSYSIEGMRRELVKNYEQEQWMLQKISHELKTPVMIIRSYAQAVNDGIFPKGTLEDSIKTIDSEALRLQERIKDLLYLTKLNYMTKHEVIEKTPINLKSLIDDVCYSFKAKKGNVQLKEDLFDCIIDGISDQLKVVFENIIDNSLRYAKTEVSITFTSNKNNLIVNIFNDGENISPKVMDNIFEPFFKGSKGNYGLGLAIAKNIIDIHDGEITIQNEKNGVSFLISLKRN
ncbi:sensor histidine kinase [Oceanirhabdus sp. W0125-5]|uniref:sensor histidine kinase n=1 Tax=Oceanirhabdus sp. W0125-5 TaxID=2999116 RepID=UPI0022F2E2D8|nr:HAMP domain-containing sensor histidine kinase [Oceanirhabdus sp. W0125-5]WBW98537.1 HAMP domain-containing sensor histidine kinase [Oceanirhabdus sp. W0125-5]